ncbi:MAG: ABC transporter ATP-binding protein [Lentisphaeria bacterium]|nr:ABC transporter ATP-binding protein [Lentisphaeria bacterium]
MSDEMILRLEQVKKSYQVGNNQLPVLKGVDFTLKRGEWVCIYGASGSGKTTLLNLVGLLERQDGGRILIDGTDVSGLNRAQSAAFRSAKLGFIFQSYHLLPELTVAENVALAGRIAGMGTLAARKKAEELLERMNLRDRMKHRPNELSGGEQQRTAIARALVNTPPLLLADEPTGNLDPHTGEEILKLFDDMQSDHPELSILMITHNHDIAARATAAVELHDGVFRKFDKR